MMDAFDDNQDTGSLCLESNNSDSSKLDQVGDLIQVKPLGMQTTCIHKQQNKIEFKNSFNKKPSVKFDLGPGP